VFVLSPLGSAILLKEKKATFPWGSVGQSCVSIYVEELVRDFYLVLLMGDEGDLNAGNTVSMCACAI